VSRVARAVILFWVVVAFVVPHLPIKNPADVNLSGELAAPSWAHPLGQGENGVDLLSNLLWASRIALGVSFFSVLLSLVTGTLVGAFLAWKGGLIDLWGMRVLEIWDALPSMVILLIAAAYLDRGVLSLVLALSLASWPFFARIVRSDVARVKHELYVEAARAVGSGFGRVLVHHLWPQLRNPLLSLAAQGFAGALLAEAALGFLGLGMSPDTPSWGMLLSQSRDAFGQAWHLVIFPSLALLSLVLSFHWLGTEQKSSFSKDNRT
jgi:peptide/nickel transport system permease protein